MLRVKGNKIFDDDLLVGKIKIAHGRLRETAYLPIGGTSYKLYREGSMSGDFLLEEDGNVLARAKPSWLVQSFDIEYEGNQYILEPGSSPWWRFVLRRTFVVLDGDNQIGLVRPLGWFSSKAIVDLPESMPVAVRVFIFWIVSFEWNRETQLPPF